MISVIVPIYNGEGYVEGCVESVLAQSFPDWELLLIDNGSGDGTAALCERLAQKDSRIRFFRQADNSGVSAARNLGLGRARGEYLTFADADDCLLPRALEELLRLLQETGADMAVGGFVPVSPGEDAAFWGGKEEAAPPSRASLAWEGRPHREYAAQAYIEHCLLQGNTHCWGVLYRRGLLAEVRFQEGLTIGEDMLFLLEASAGAKKITVTPAPLYRYLVHSGGVMERPFTSSYMDQLLCWQKALRLITQRCPRLISRAESILLVSALLVAGKLARLSPAERENYASYHRDCHRLVKEYGGKKEALSLLPAGYPLKVRLYRDFPGLYLRLYHRWKK